jgi:hypothetical protein
MTSNRTTRSRVGPRWPMEPYGSASCASATTTGSLSPTKAPLCGCSRLRWS